MLGEKNAITNFKLTNQRIRDRLKAQGSSTTDSRMIRLNSIITTCDFAIVIMDFVIYLTSLDLQKYYSKMVRMLPGSLNILIRGSHIKEELKKRILSFRESQLWH